MPEEPTTNVKIYDRPERKLPIPLPLLVGISLVVVLLVGFLLYKTVLHPALPAVKPQVGLVSFAWTSSRFLPQDANTLPISMRR